MAGISQWNIRGLKVGSNSFFKVRKCVLKLEDVQKTNILSIQETHLKTDDQIPNKLKNFGHLYHILSTHAPENDNGAGIILFINKTEELIEQEELYPGRLLYAKIQNKVTSEVRNIFSFYAKSKATKIEIKNIMSTILNKVKNNNLSGIILCGDFNFVTSLLDRNSSTFTSVDNNYRHEWGKIQLELELIDCFRVTNPKRRYYTYTHTNGTSHASLDRIYVSKDLVGKILTNTIDYASESDHKIVNVSLGRNIEKGPGQWIFNNTLLKDDKFSDEIRAIIKDFVENKDDFGSKMVLWEFLKQNMASSSRNYASKKAREERKKIDDVKKRIEILESIPIEDTTPNLLHTIENLKEVENNFTSKKIQGSLLRSKIPGVENGELNMAYYTKIEKMRAEQNTIFSLMDSNGLLVEGTEGISKVVHNFYENLYSKETECENSQNDFLKGVTIKLSQEEREKLDEEFTIEELRESLSDLQKNKSPGCDGLTREFYDFFWDDLSALYFECVNEIQEKGELTESQKKGLIRISYKKNGRIHIENYRPITLLNVDLKILTRTLAKRMTSVLPKLIHDSQRCIPGRKITKNIHIVQDLIDTINKDDGKAAFVFLDQEKAFDRISHKFMFKTLEAFGFGDNFIKWVKIIYTDTKSAVKVNGFLTPEFSIERGVRQGCPLSALLYVLCAEVLGIEIRKNKNIVGYKHSRTEEHKSCQYADDLVVVITTLESLNELFRILKKFEYATNAKINKSKTECLWVGQWKNNQETPLGLKWTNDKVYFTGIYVGNDRSDCNLQGFTEIIEKIKTKLSYWKGKFICLKGKITVLNVFVLSKLWYCLECQDIPKNLKNDLDKMLANFIWNDIHQRNMEVLYMDYKNGGLQLQDIDTKMKTFRIKWLSELLHCMPKSIERHLADTLVGKHNLIYGLKLSYSTNKFDNDINNFFYRNALKMWRSIQVTFRPGNIHEIRRDWVYENSLLKDENGKSFKPPSYFPAYAPEYICDLPITNHPREFKGIYKKMIPQVNKAFSKITFSSKKINEFFVLSEENKEQNLLTISFKELYKILLMTKHSVTQIWTGKWEEDAGVEANEWEGIWDNMHNKMLNLKIQSSLWETTHRNFMCAYFAKLVFNKSGICQLCMEEQLNRVHIFINCNVILELYQKFLFITNKLVNIGPVHYLERAFGIKISKPANKREELRNYVNFCIRHIVFRSRNKRLGRTVINIILSLCFKIENFIKSDLKQKYDLAVETGRLRVFEETFLVDNILGEIKDGRLIFQRFWE